MRRGNDPWWSAEAERRPAGTLARGAWETRAQVPRGRPDTRRLLTALSNGFPRRVTVSAHWCFWAPRPASLLTTAPQTQSSAKRRITAVIFTVFFPIPSRVPGARWDISNICRIREWVDDHTFWHYSLYSFWNPCLNEKGTSPLLTLYSAPQCHWLFISKVFTCDDSLDTGLRHQWQDRNPMSKSEIQDWKIRNPDLNRRHGTRAGLEAGQLNTIFGSECPKSLDLSKAQGS